MAKKTVLSKLHHPVHTALLVFATLLLVIAIPLTVLFSQKQQETRQRAASSYYPTLPPGSPLPSDADCAARVIRNPWEPRPDNTTANHTTFPNYHVQPDPNALEQVYVNRVTGNFTGTTDEILQWGACKWGIELDMVRAQAVQESDWHQATLGDCRGSPIPETHGCQSLGILQIKGANSPPDYPGTWPYAYQSTAFNVDYALAIRRACYDGKVTYLGTGYQAGDLWGCMGVWFSGDWYSQGAKNYIAQVQQAYNNETWNTYGAGPAPAFSANPPTTQPTSPPASTIIPSSQPSPTPVKKSPTPTLSLATPTLYCLGSCLTIAPSPLATARPSEIPVPSSQPTLSGQPGTEPSSTPLTNPRPRGKSPRGLLAILLEFLQILLNFLKLLF